MSGRAIGTVLVANRGEIACRVIRTLRRLGLRSVAVYHFVDRDAPHVRMADDARELQGAVPAGAYLDAAQIIAAAHAAGADAIHPGYGFLSENAEFARAVEDAGLVFVGPSAQTIELMGDKIASRAFAEAQGVPVAPSALDTGDAAAFVAAAEAIGFPLLIKASAGGGGKGMKIVAVREELEGAISAARSEALRYFGDERVYAEKLVSQPRHIEVQVLGDGAGKVVHLHERECSIQRRHQKVVEEAPAPNLAADLREAICTAAVNLAAAARYRNAGTIEFILGGDGAFYFLEMNTRLQVEHPVTEEITGLDLVEWQLKIAAGEPLTLEQERLGVQGHAIEVRICAEQPEFDFRPATGVCGVLDWPEAARIESGIAEGQQVTAAFDPLLAKLVVHAETRAAAGDKLAAALRETTLLGIANNIDYLHRIAVHPAFSAGELDTGFLARHAGELVPEPGAPPVAAICAALAGDPAFRTMIARVPDLHAAIGGWSN
ncbi:acetyl-CoA carboxylase biotin carboxylase subunit [Novosphingobium sp.]|uniref:acetyl-CoA carboxylase biotin carboxylase subunit n=1 Tax=Novosphingobium sp. TaxID=1874826 RepID=UPI003BAC72C7